MSSNDNNKLRWQCDKQGCFNTKKRPKLEVFYDLLPGKIAIGDIDGIVEINSKFLILEYKGYGVPLPKGQQIMYERLTKIAPFTVIVVAGDCETMETKEYFIYYNGACGKTKQTNLGGLRDLVGRWVSWAKNQ